jgi:hypothetical protein
MSTRAAPQAPGASRSSTGSVDDAGAREKVRKHLDAQDHVTPHFTWAESPWAEFACQDAVKTAIPANLRTNTIRLCWLR